MNSQLYTFHIPGVCSCELMTKPAMQLKDINNPRVYVNRRRNADSFSELAHRRKQQCQQGVQNVTNMERMFSGATAFNREPLSAWTPNNVTNITGMFSGATATGPDDYVYSWKRVGINPDDAFSR